MKRPWLLLPLGLLAGAIAFGAAFWLRTQPQRQAAAAPGAELEWLRREFQLSEDVFRRVSELHRNYQPTCAELCRRIADQNRRLRDTVGRTNAMTDEIRELVSATGRARDDCRQAMLTHLYAVAREMPPEAGNRYLQIMMQATCVLQEARPIDAIQPGAGGAHHHHE